MFHMDAHAYTYWESTRQHYFSEVHYLGLSIKTLSIKFPEQRAIIILNTYPSLLKEHGNGPSRFSAFIHHNNSIFYYSNVTREITGHISNGIKIAHRAFVESNS